MDRAAIVRHLLDMLGSGSSTGLRIGGICATELAERFGTPAFVYDAGVLRRRYEAVVRALPVDQVLFAVKANPCLAVVQVLADAGAGADVASAGEIHVARRAGVVGEKIQFAGPGKSRADLALAVGEGVLTINVEGAAEIDLLAEIAAAREGVAGVAVRVNPSVAVADARLRMGGGSSKFGIDAEAVAAHVRRIAADPALELRGLHCYLGTQIFQADAWLASVRDLFELAESVAAETGESLGRLNLGGGFGAPCRAGEEEFDLAAAGRGLGALLQQQRGPRHTTVELGRYLTAPAGVYLSRVLQVKESRGQRFAILDGGMHHFAAAAGVGSMIRREFPIVAAVDPLATDGEPHNLCGPLCTPADEFASEVDLPRLEAGDLVGVLSAGAYGLTFSNVMFLSHPAPAEVLVDGDQAYLARQPGRPEDALRGQFLPGEG